MKREEEKEGDGVATEQGEGAEGRTRRKHKTSKQTKIIQEAGGKKKHGENRDEKQRKKRKRGQQKKEGAEDRRRVEKNTKK